MFVGEAKALDVVRRGDFERGQLISFQQSEKKAKGKNVECRAWTIKCESNINNDDISGGILMRIQSAE